MLTQASPLVSLRVVFPCAVGSSLPTVLFQIPPLRCLSRIFFGRVRGMFRGKLCHRQLSPHTKHNIPALEPLTPNRVYKTTTREHKSTTRVHVITSR